MPAEPQRAFSQTQLVVGAAAGPELLLPATPANLGAIASRKTLVGGPNGESIESDVFSSISR